MRNVITTTIGVHSAHVIRSASPVGTHYTRVYSIKTQQSTETASGITDESRCRHRAGRDANLTVHISDSEGGEERALFLR